MRRVTISQCVRLFFLIAALPVAIVFLSPASRRGSGNAGGCQCF